jgi:hypothetical protein
VLLRFNITRELVDDLRCVRHSHERGRDHDGSDNNDDHGG